MIKIENVDVSGWEAAIRGMRNPMNSWEKSDSYYGCGSGEDNTYPTCGDICIDKCRYIIGNNDLSLMKRLVNAGTDHAKFLRMINVTCDIIAPLYWWSEYDTYKVGTVANSCSKMHKLLAKPFEMNDFSLDKLLGYKREIKQFVPDISEEDVAYEVWVYYDEEYDISSLGRVKHKFKTHYRLLSGSLHKDGYRYVTLHGKQLPIHKLVAMIFHNDDFNDGLVVNHKDGNKQNNRQENLEWVTQSENILHAYKNNLQPKSVTTYKGKFTEQQRQEIKDLWDNGIFSKRQIAKQYDVSHTCINDIINDKYKYAENINVYEEFARPVVDTLNELRDMWINCDNENDKKEIWYNILQLLPESYNQKRTVQLNYQVLLNIYKSRKNHKLDEWSVGFMKWIESLPYSELITGKEVSDNETL